MDDELDVLETIDEIVHKASLDNAQTHEETFKKGHILSLPIEHLSDLYILLNDLLTARNEGKTTEKPQFEKEDSHFDRISCKG